jgi:hypothetical protein
MERTEERVTDEDLFFCAPRTREPDKVGASAAADT